MPARRRLITDAGGQKVEAVEVERQRRDASRRGVAVRRVVRRRQLGRAAAALGERRASRRAWRIRRGWSGKRYMAHLATMMQGFHPFRRNATVFQKTVAINDFYLRGPDTDYPLGQIQSQGRTHGVMAQTACPVDPVVGVRRRGCRAASTGW